MTCALVLRAGLAAVCLLSTAATATAQATTPPPAEPWAMTDNSFFVEEAFNEERGVVQNIFSWARDEAGGWEGVFTQEWPAPAMRHQLSYTVPFSWGNVGTHIGAVQLNYRVQALTEGPGRPALSPRVTVILPTGSSDDNGDHQGLQCNLPFSRQAGDIYVHWNAGLTWLHGLAWGPRTANLTSPQLAGSLIWRMQPMWHLMLESVVSFDDTIGENRQRSHETSVLVSPGVRGGWNVGDRQIVIGAALPVSRASGDSSVSMLFYSSFETPFTRNR